MLDSVAGSIPASSSRIQSSQIYNSVAGSIPASSNRIWVIGSYFGSELSGVESHKQEFGVKWFLGLGGNSQRSKVHPLTHWCGPLQDRSLSSPCHKTCDRFKSYGPPAEQFGLDMVRFVRFGTNCTNPTSHPIGFESIASFMARRQERMRS